jgi:hypothetical protein
MATQDLSNYLPRQATAGLPAGFLSALPVKRAHPTPVTFLLHWPVTHPDFPGVDGYYDIQQDGASASLYLSGSTIG